MAVAHGPRHAADLRRPSPTDPLPRAGPPVPDVTVAATPYHAGMTWPRSGSAASQLAAAPPRGLMP